MNGRSEAWAPGPSLSCESSANTAAKAQGSPKPSRRTPDSIIIDNCWSYLYFEFGIFKKDPALYNLINLIIIAIGLASLFDNDLQLSALNLKIFNSLALILAPLNSPLSHNSD